MRALNLRVGSLASGGRVTIWMLALVWQASRAPGVEPAKPFLEGLRARGYYDVALDYLEQMKTSPLAPAELKGTLAYEQAVTLIEASRVQRDIRVREKQLDEAQTLLRQFVAQVSESPSANAARNQLGNLITERARLKVELSKLGDKSPRLAEAQKLYAEAGTVFRDLQGRIREQLQAIPKALNERDRQQAQMVEQRNQLRADYVQVQLLTAAIREETADTYGAESAEYRQVLAEAEKLYGEIFAKYSDFLAGLYARMYQGRVNQKLGKSKEALECFGQLLDLQEGSEAFRTLKTKAMKLAMECWLEPAQKNFREAISRSAEWVTKARPTEDRDPDWLAIRLLLARAYKLQAESASSPDAKNSPTPAQALSEARRLAQSVAKYASEHQAEAQELVAMLGGVTRTNQRPALKSFSEARDAGREALDMLEAAKLVVARVPDRIAKEQEAMAKAELQSQLDQAQQRIATGPQEALDFFRLAARLADSKTPPEELNTVRYFLAYLYYLNAQYYESALLGEFVARRFPGNSAASQCAKIALASYLKLFAETSSDDQQFEQERVIAVAQYMLERWPDRPEAEEAVHTLVPFLIQEGNFSAAEDLLGKIPQDSTHRGEAELRLGHALWSKYLRTVRELKSPGQSGDAEDPDGDKKKAELAALQVQAERLLASGATRVDGASVDAVQATALLSLAQIYVETRQANKAIEVFENPNCGLLKLLESNASAIQDAAFTEEAYKTALRAYILALPKAETSGVMIRKAKDIMDAMRSKAGATADGQERMNAVFLGVARGLEEQLRQASPESRPAVTKGVETFLRQLSTDATELSVLSWVAETFLSLAGGREGERPLSAESKAYCQAAAATFQKALDRVQRDPQKRIQLQVRKAIALRGSQDYAAASDLFEEVLRANPRLLNVQVEAAKTYQAWADSSKSEPIYQRAMLGKEPDPASHQVLIWGWGKIAQTTASYPQFVDTFHEARYNLALCRFHLAEALLGDRRKELLDAAERDIALTHRLYGLGGEKWVSQYDLLLKGIQAYKGDHLSGVKALPPTDRAAPAKKLEK